MKDKKSAPTPGARQVACGVPWCIGLTDDGDQFCRVHRSDKLRTQWPPPVSRELELRFLEAMRGPSALHVDARH
jgi:hypothetical protein